jgi:thioredoxin 1
MAGVLNITAEQFETEVLKADLPVLVDFYADWCMPCRAMAPILSHLADELNGTLKIAKVNVEDAPVLAGQYRISSIPALLLFRGGQVVEHIVGLLPPEALRQRLQRALAPVA